MAGRPAGAQNKDKPFRDALRLEIAAAQDEQDHRSLRKIASKLLAQAAGGDVQAIKEVADRLDGKVPQAIGGSDELPGIQIDEIRLTVVDPRRPDSEGVPPAD